MKKMSLMFAIGMTVLWSCSQDDELSQGDKDSSTVTSDKMFMCTEILPAQSENGITNKIKGGIYKPSIWTNGQTIRIKFLNGETSLQNKVKLYAPMWTKYANLNFQFVNSNENADIKIGFKFNGDNSSWSNYGKECQIKSQNMPSMNFGSINSNTSDENARSMILHEFGHAVGMIHEHQNPNGNIQWNRPKVYDYYWNNNKWTKEQVDLNIFYKYDSSITNFSTYDNLSIMHYSIDSSLTLNGYSVSPNLYLSYEDVHFINKWYPFPVKSIVMPSERIDIESNWIHPIISPNGLYSLIYEYQTLYIKNNSTKAKIWETGVKSYFPKGFFEMNNNGGLYQWISDINGHFPIPISYTQGCIYAELHMQDDGNLVIYQNNVAKWSSKEGRLY